MDFPSFGRFRTLRGNSGSRGRAFVQPHAFSRLNSRPNQLFPRNWVLCHYNLFKDGKDETDHSDEEQPEEEVNEKDVDQLLRVTDVDLNVSENTTRHHTDKFDITETYIDKTCSLVVRRGDTFTIKLHFNREYDKDKDDIRVVFEISDNPMPSKGTSVTLHVKDGVKPRHWSAGVSHMQDDWVVIEIRTPGDCMIGKWTLHVDSVLASECDEDQRKLDRYTHDHPIYLLFNPWSNMDTVYMEDTELLEEYILNDTGKVYTGNYKQIYGRPWVFGQFEAIVLDCCFYLLDAAKLNYSSRGDPVRVCRTISAIVNAQDDDGVLIGNWSGNYDGGTAPTKWTGSVRILQEFWETKKSVKFGQCWVFSALSTTVSRALGIPARSITNFASAHDTDGSITIDSHWDEFGDPIEYLNHDSVWNFHLWNEGWMSRPDLPSGNGGWQAFDATPQETSNGIYCAGPCPVAAIKEGQVSLPHDTAFVFAEVNADKIHWIQTANHEMKKVLQKNKVGKKISTKWPISKKKPWNVLMERDKWREDITQNYKNKEGSDLERRAVLRANLASTRPGLYGDDTKHDVKFELEERDDILVGSNFNVVLKMQNKSREERTVHVTVTCASTFYTGVMRGKVKSQSYCVTLGAIKSDSVVLRITMDDYLHLIVDQAPFKISTIAYVEETKQDYADNDEFRLRRPDVQLECPDSVCVNEPFTCKFSLQNSMPVHLTACQWLFEGPGIQKPFAKDQRDIEPYETVTDTLVMKPTKCGEREIVVSFDSKELKDVTGCFTITVE